MINWAFVDAALIIIGTLMIIALALLLLGLCQAAGKDAPKMDDGGTE